MIIRLFAQLWYFLIPSQINMFLTKYIMRFEFVRHWSSDIMVCFVDIFQPAILLYIIWAHLREFPLTLMQLIACWRLIWTHVSSFSWTIWHLGSAYYRIKYIINYYIIVQINNIVFVDNVTNESCLYIPYQNKHLIQWNDNIWLIIAHS